MYGICYYTMHIYTDVEGDISMFAPVVPIQRYH